jgi:hypothetical protein
MIGIANTSYKLSRVGGDHFIAVLPDCALRLERKLLSLGSQARRSGGVGSCAATALFRVAAGCSGGRAATGAGSTGRIAARKRLSQWRIARPDPESLLPYDKLGRRRDRHGSTRKPGYPRRIAHYLFNFSDGDRQQATALLHAKMWGVGRHERHRDALAPGDLALIYLPAPDAELIGRAELATPGHDWTPSETEAYPGDSPSGVLLSQVEEWDPPVPMDTVVQRIDPTASNPLVQANAAAGFRTGVVRITGDEYEAALALSREARGT